MPTNDNIDYSAFNETPHGAFISAAEKTTKPQWYVIVAGVDGSERIFIPVDHFEALQPGKVGEDFIGLARLEPKSDGPGEPKIFVRLPDKLVFEGKGLNIDRLAGEKHPGDVRSILVARPVHDVSDIPEDLAPVGRGIYLSRAAAAKLTY